MIPRKLYQHPSPRCHEHERTPECPQRLLNTRDSCYERCESMGNIIKHTVVSSLAQQLDICPMQQQNGTCVVWCSFIPSNVPCKQSTSEIRRNFEKEIPFCAWRSSLCNVSPECLCNFNPALSPPISDHYGIKRTGWIYNRTLHTRNSANLLSLAWSSPSSHNKKNRWGPLLACMLHQRVRQLKFEYVLKDTTSSTEVLVVETDSTTVLQWSTDQ